VIAAFIPLAAGIYLLVSTGWALAERSFFWRTGRISGAAPSPTGTPGTPSPPSPPSPPRVTTGRGGRVSGASRRGHESASA
jgi:hypothetical protein